MFLKLYMTLTKTWRNINANKQIAKIIHSPATAAAPFLVDPGNIIINIILFNIFFNELLLTTLLMSYYLIRNYARLMKYYYSIDLFKDLLHSLFQTLFSLFEMCQKNYKNKR